MTDRESDGPGTEAPAEDVLEQRDPVGDEVTDDAPPAETPADVDPADLAEQLRAVDTGDDEYR
jgi:hypothetical protein